MRLRNRTLAQTARAARIAEARATLNCLPKGGVATFVLPPGSFERRETARRIAAQAHALWGAGSYRVASQGESYTVSRLSDPPLPAIKLFASPSCPTDYLEITPRDTELLGSIVTLPAADRIAVLQELLRREGPLLLLRLFSGFIGMANSVIENSREFFEIAGIVHGNLHPNQAEHPNLPTVLGALRGIGLTDRVRPEKVCVGCAFRRGTPANQSPITTQDAWYSLTPGAADFMCHQELDERGSPTTICRGYAQWLSRKNADEDEELRQEIMEDS